MSRFSLDLLVRPPNGGKYEGPLTSHIFVRKHGSFTYPGEFETESVTICSCRGIEELEQEIDRLQHELEVIRRKARKKYSGRDID